MEKKEEGKVLTQSSETQSADQTAAAAVPKAAEAAAAPPAKQDIAEVLDKDVKNELSSHTESAMATADRSKDLGGKKVEFTSKDTRYRRRERKKNSRGDREKVVASGDDRRHGGGGAHVNSYLKFLKSSPTPFHAVATTAGLLKKGGFTELKESKAWDIAPGGSYYYIRNHSSIFAFTVGEKWVKSSPFLIFGAHTDSPTLKVKTRDKHYGNGFSNMNVQPYGGGQWTSWVDRDLHVAGAALVKSEEAVKAELFSLPFLIRIPSLAIHLGGPRDEAKIDKQSEINPLVTMASNYDLVTEIGRNLQVDSRKILSYDARVVDSQPPALGGLSNEFVYAGQQDNLSMCYSCVTALCEQAKESNRDSSLVHVMALFDNEEVGSNSVVGAKSSSFRDMLRRIGHCLAVKAQESAMNEEDYAISFSKSLIVSADVSHGFHPYFSSKYDGTQQRANLNGGVIIKSAAKANQTTEFVGVALVKQIALKYSIPIQFIVPRNDMSTGSTIGPHIAASTGIRVIDMGAPLLSMHSIREMGGSADINHSVKLFSAIMRDYESNIALFE